ncbi:MAG: phosphatidate cytidylyltransferase [Ignavibacteria bacterium]|nr:phosphatidate cytidylyltransferase [Ignavibacteria bacterium]
MSKNNTLVRTVVALIAAPIILALCYLGGYYFLPVALIIGCVAYYEYFTLAKHKHTHPLLWVGEAGLILLTGVALVKPGDLYSVFTMVILFVVLFEMFRNRGSAILNLGSTLLGITYIGIAMSSLVLIRELFTGIDYQQGGWLIISILASIWVCDSAAFFGGITFGKHRLFLRVSPKKSWEGAVFGFVFAILTMVAAKYIIMKSLDLTDSIIIGAIVGTIGQLGDLAESLIKRDAGVKDSSNLIPGHGGVFDRFDSLIAVAPVVYFYLKHFASI